jgi:ribosomal protein L11 methyltransferase
MGNRWIEISLSVDGELAEAVAEVLARYLPNGIVIESTAIENTTDLSTGVPVGPLKVCGYLPVDDELEEKRRQIEEALWYLGRIQPLPTPKYATIQETNWMEAWKERYQPIRIGQNLVIVPAWMESPTPDRIAVRIDPGMAFGTGTHPTTQLCLEILESELQQALTIQTPPQAVSIIDVGCGSGILSIAALKMGAANALGVDTDAEAIKAAHDNAKLNGIKRGLRLGVGSLADIQNGTFGDKQAALVVANILAPVIVRLLQGGLAHLISFGGKLILSGILETQVPEVEAAVHESGMQMVGRYQSADWVALVAAND